MKTGAGMEQGWSRDGSPSEGWAVAPVLNYAPLWPVALDINLHQTDGAGGTEASGFPRGYHLYCLC